MKKKLLWVEIETSAPLGGRVQLDAVFEDPQDGKKFLHRQVMVKDVERAIAIREALEKRATLKSTSFGSTFVSIIYYMDQMYGSSV